MPRQYVVDGKFVSRDEYLKSREKAVEQAQTQAEKNAKTAAKETK